MGTRLLSVSFLDEITVTALKQEPNLFSNPLLACSSFYQMPWDVLVLGDASLRDPPKGNNLLSHDLNQ